MDVISFGLAKAFVKNLFSNPVGVTGYTPTVPSGLGWDTTNCPISGTVTDLYGTGRHVASLVVTPESLFDAVSVGRSAPGATFYVNASTGQDTNAGTSSASAFKSIWKAIVAANTSGVPSTVFVTAGSYGRTNNPWYNGGAGVVPSVDVALVATGGKVITGSFDAPATPARDATNTNCFTWAVASGTVNRVVDTIENTRFGNYTEMVNVSTAALCNATPNSWALVSGVLYVNRRDQQTPTAGNTKVYRSGTKTLLLTNATNIYIGGQSGNDGWLFEGGDSNGVIDTSMSAGTTGRYVLAVKNSSFKYGGGIVDNAARSVGVADWQGLACFFNCSADAGWTDGWNFHNAHALAMQVLTVNCTGHDNGRSGQQSCNGWTSHETVIGADIAGYYAGNHGGTCRSINSSKTWFSGTLVRDDYGDIGLSGGSGVVSPTAFRVDDTAIYWCERTRIDMPGSGYAYTTGGGASVVNRRNCWPTAAADSGPGTFGTY
jgi:hypothetical protein